MANGIAGMSSTRILRHSIGWQTLFVLLASTFFCGVAPAQSGSLLQSDVGPVAEARRQAMLENANAGTGVVSPPSRSLRAAPPTIGGQAATGAMTRPNPYTGALTLSETSWTYESPAAARIYRLNDIVTIRVDEISRLAAEGNSESRRTTLWDALLSDWVSLRSLELKPSAQNDGDPRVQGSANQLYRADASLESRQSMSFNIAARVVDVRPNGELVLEARKTILYNENVWETTLSGICRAEDVSADNTVLSRDMVDLQISSRERGRMRDGYKRGWFARFIDRIAPF